VTAGPVKAAEAGPVMRIVMPVPPSITFSACRGDMTPDTWRVVVVLAIRRYEVQSLAGIVDAAIRPPSLKATPTPPDHSYVSRKFPA